MYNLQLIYAYVDVCLNELSTQVSGKVWNLNESCYLIPHNYLADMVCLLAEWSDTKVLRQVGQISIPASSVLHV